MPARSSVETCTKTSFPPPSRTMKPNPLAALYHFTVPISWTLASKGCRSNGDLKFFRGEREGDVCPRSRSGRIPARTTSSPPLRQCTRHDSSAEVEYFAGRRARRPSPIGIDRHHSQPHRDQRLGANCLGFAPVAGDDSPLYRWPDAEASCPYGVERPRRFEIKPPDPQCGTASTADIPDGARNEGVTFARDSPLEGARFEPSVPRQKDLC